MYINLLVFTVLIYVISCSLQTEAKDANFQASNPTRKRRAAYGRDAQLGEVPYHVAIYSGDHLLCNGAISHDKNGNWFVLTTAECATEPKSVGDDVRQPHSLQIIAGVVDRTDISDQYAQYRNVSAIYRHPEWDRDFKKHDLAILIPHGPFQKTKYVQAVSLPEERDRPSMPYTTVFNLAGWGFRSLDEDIYPNILQIIEVGWANNDDCQRHSGHGGYYKFMHKRSTLCTWDAKSNGDKAMCHGDWGAGAVAHNPEEPTLLRLYGIFYYTDYGKEDNLILTQTFKLKK